MINPLLAKVYGIILENKLAFGLKVKVSELKAKRVLEGSTQQQTTSLRLRSFWRNAAMINPISYVALWTLEMLSIQFLEITYGIY